MRYSIVRRTPSWQKLAEPRESVVCEVDRDEDPTCIRPGGGKLLYNNGRKIYDSPNRATN
jgi:hypothetical protein